MSGSERSTSPAPFLPARRLPLLFLGFGHACLALALTLVVVDPRGIGGFFYHPRLVAVVHLITLGFITASILGSIHLVGPLALRTALPARGPDLPAFAAYAVGVAGMVGHFWLAEPTGMVWAATLVVCAVTYSALRVLRALCAAPLPREAKLPIVLGFSNALAAAGTGMLLGVNKIHPFLPCSQIQGVAAHAHLAAVGWATMLVIGAGQRLLPMMLPAAMPRGARLLVAPLLLEAGIVGLAATLVLDWPLLVPSATAMVAGVAWFVGLVVSMLRHGRPAPTTLPRPDWSLAHALQALVYLTVATGLGLFLALAPPSEAALRATMAYGVAGLVGFLAQMIVGVEGRLLPLAAWVWAFAAGGYAELPTGVHALSDRRLQAAVFALWIAGVPLLAAGLALDAPSSTRAGALAVLAGVVLAALNAAVVVARARTGRAAHSVRPSAVA